jgi:multicomponent Na+:H+ antiporter subunit C
VSYAPYALAVWLVIVGLLGIVRSRNLIHLVLCVTIVQSSTYVLLLAIGYRKHASAPIFADTSTKTKVVDPVVQALTLTDIVVSVTVAAVLLALVLDAHERKGTLDPAELTELHG